MNQKRLDFLDIAKGLAIIFVLYSHSCGFLVMGKGIVAFYMALFFFVSGYVYKPGRPVKQSISRKLKQLLIPYAGFTLLLYAEHVAVGFVKHELTKKSLIMPLLGAIYSRAAITFDYTLEYNDLFLISNSPMWFITAMALASVLFYPTVDKFLENKKNMWIITGLFVAITIAFHYCPFLLPWSIDTVFACTLFMLWGAKLGSIQYYSDENQLKTPLWLVLLAFVIYGVVTTYAKPINLSLREYGYPGILGACWFLTAAFAGSLTFIWICKYLEKLPFAKVFTIVGRHTYTLMALHILLIKYLNKVYFILHMNFPFERSCVWYWVYWTLMFVVIIAICIAFDWCLAKVKAFCGQMFCRKEK